MSDIPRTGAFTRSMSFLASADPSQPRFFMDAQQDEAATAAAGRPIFKQRELVQILQPGSPNQPVFEVTDEYRNRWPEQYAAFKRGEEMSVEGTPLEQWPVLNRQMVMELKALQIYTVEQCAALSDLAVQKIGLGGRAIRDRALAYLDDAAAVALQERLTHENDQQRAEIMSLRRQVEELGSLVNSLHSQMMTAQNAPHPLATAVPMHSDPVEMAKMGSSYQTQQPVAQSALDRLTSAPVKRRGRPSNAELAARAAQQQPQAEA